jgi:tetraacyldisaccharide 4'-kinase
VSVGNLTAGGTGKTPVVIEIVSLLLARGAKPALVSRGYGREGARRPLVLPPGETPGPKADLRWGDEPSLFRIRHPGVPIVLDPDRVRGARIAAGRFGADVVVLDDGMQHRRLHRDLEIVVVHGLEPFGNGHLLPRGILREPPEALRRADIVLVQALEGTRPDLDSLLDRGGAPPDRIRFTYEPTRLVAPNGDERSPSEALPKTRVLAVSGIGRPESFERTLERCGAMIAGTLRFPDHHRFDAPDRARIAREAERLRALPVTTEKDRCRLTEKEAREAGLHTLAVRLVMEDRDRSADRILSPLWEEPSIDPQV